MMDDKNQYTGGCDLCKGVVATERYDGYLGSIIYLCKACFKILKSKRVLLLNKNQSPIESLKVIRDGMKSDWAKSKIDELIKFYTA